jgi:hypothetical protein
LDDKKELDFDVEKDNDPALHTYMTNSYTVLEIKYRDQANIHPSISRFRLIGWRSTKQILLKQERAAEDNLVLS